MRKLALRLLLMPMLLGLLLLSSVPIAGAAWWNVTSQGSCPNGVEAASWLAWGGYTSSAFGETYGWLWWWTGSSWRQMKSGYNSYTGSPGAAGVDNSRASITGWWNETGGHLSNFFAGQQNSDSGQFYCQ